MRPRLWVVALAWLGLVTASACSSDESADVADVALRLQSCGLLSDGYVRAEMVPFYVPTACYADCLAETSCDELAGVLCSETADPLRRCDERCAFHCDGGALIAVEAVCDGRQQCEDGTDEAGCKMFLCDGGGTVPDRLRCNHQYDCDDGSDERGCEWRRCGTVTLVERNICDGYEDCEDGSDEANCPVFLCADGEVTAAGARCNGWAQCADASDEADCAELSLSCDG